MCHWISESEIRRMHDLQTDKHRHSVTQPEQRPAALGELGIAAMLRNIISRFRSQKPARAPHKTVEV